MQQRCPKRPLKINRFKQVRAVGFVHWFRPLLVCCGLMSAFGRVGRFSEEGSDRLNIPNRSDFLSESGTNSSLLFFLLFDKWWLVHALFYGQMGRLSSILNAGDEWGLLSSLNVECCPFPIHIQINCGSLVRYRGFLIPASSDHRSYSDDVMGVVRNRRKNSGPHVLSDLNAHRRSFFLKLYGRKRRHSRR